MIALAALLLLLAVGLLAGGLAEGSAELQWASFGASALAAIALGLGELRRRTAAKRNDRVPREPVSLPATPAERPPTEAAAPAFRRVPAATGATGLLGPLAAGPPTGPAPSTAAPASADRLPRATGAHAAPPPGGPTTAPSTRPPSTGAHSASQPVAPALLPDGEPPVEEVEVTDLLLVLDLTDDVLVVDEHPRYHLAGCPHLAGAETIPVALDQARTDGFTPCATCAPDRNLAERERTRRSAS